MNLRLGEQDHVAGRVYVDWRDLNEVQVGHRSACKQLVHNV